MTPTQAPSLLRLVAAVLVSLVLAGPAATRSPAQCLQWGWKPGQGVPGVDGAVHALTSWDPDGPGPQGELLVVGGSFAVAGNVLANCIATWDGTCWQPLGSGMNGAVLAVSICNGELIAGGTFTTAGGVTCNHIARWNGTGWQPLGSGMDDWVLALTVHNGDLIAGGGFATAGGVACNYIARWDGASWQSLGSVSLIDTDVPEIVVVHLDCDIRAKFFEFQLSSADYFEFIGMIFSDIELEGTR